MKIYKIAKDWQDKKTIFEDETGYIKGYQMDDGRWSIMEFVIKPKFRGKGRARELASHLPWKCRLFAQPLEKDGIKPIDTEILIKFYESLGFRSDIYSDLFPKEMFRG
jgi:ribosomal protein S18 acetylase RimI-like enzyme